MDTIAPFRSSSFLSSKVWTFTKWFQRGDHSQTVPTSFLRWSWEWVGVGEGVWWQILTHYKMSLLLIICSLFREDVFKSIYSVNMRQMWASWQCHLPGCVPCWSMTWSSSANLVGLSWCWNEVTSPEHLETMPGTCIDQQVILIIHMQSLENFKKSQMV